MQHPATQARDEPLEAKLREEWSGFASSRTWAQSRVEIHRGWDLGAPGH